MQEENERPGKNSEREHVRHFLHKKNFWRFYVVVVQNNGKEMYKKSVLIRPIVVFSPFSGVDFAT